MKLGRATLDGGPHPVIVHDGALELASGSIETGFVGTGTRVSRPGHPLLAPVVPSKIVALGRNYRRHAAELGNEVPAVPKIFLKPVSAIIGPDDTIEIPPMTTRVDPEGELAVVIGRRMFRESEETVLSGIFGYTILNDITARDFQKADGVFTRAKGFDTFCPMGPWIETELDPTDLAQSVEVNGELRSQGRTSQMVFDIATSLAFINQVMTLLPGDVVAMGTPPGVAPIRDGDHVVVEIEGIGRLANPVANREDR